MGCWPESKAERVLGIGALLCVVGAIFSAASYEALNMLIIPDAIVAIVGGAHFYLETKSPGFDHGTGCCASAGRGAVLLVVIVCSLASLPLAIMVFIAAFPGVGSELAPATVILAGACSLPGILAVLVSSVCLRCGCASDAAQGQTHAVTKSTEIVAS